MGEFGIFVYLSVANVAYSITIIALILGIILIINHIRKNGLTLRGVLVFFFCLLCLVPIFGWALFVAYCLRRYKKRRKEFKKTFLIDKNKIDRKLNLFTGSSNGEIVVSICSNRTKSELLNLYSGLNTKVIERYPETRDEAQRNAFA